MVIFTVMIDCMGRVWYGMVKTSSFVLGVDAIRKFIGVLRRCSILFNYASMTYTTPISPMLFGWCDERQATQPPITASLILMLILPF